MFVIFIPTAGRPNHTDIGGNIIDQLHNLIWPHVLIRFPNGRWHLSLVRAGIVSSSTSIHILIKSTWFRGFILYSTCSTSNSSRFLIIAIDRKSSNEAFELGIVTFLLITKCKPLLKTDAVSEQQACFYFLELGKSCLSGIQPLPFLVPFSNHNVSLLLRTTQGYPYATGEYLFFPPNQDSCIQGFS